MKRIAVDMDGVLADVYSQFIAMHAAEFGIEIPRDQAIGRPEAEVFINERKYVNAPGFFRNAPVMEHSQRILQQLHQQYEVFIVSAAMEFPNSLSEKLSWLGEHFSFLNWKQFVFCGSKAIIKADIMIDDYFKNLDHFSGETTLLFTQPHNQLAVTGRHTRIQTWLDIEALLLK